MDTRTWVLAIISVGLLTGCTAGEESGEDQGPADTNADGQVMADATEDVHQMDSGASDARPDGQEVDAGRERISTDAAKVDCYSTPCSGTKRCYWPGRGDDECEICSVGPNCPKKCQYGCLERCFLDGTCPDEGDTCKDGVAEGARVCVPDDW